MTAYPARVEREAEGMVVLTLPDVPELVVIAPRASRISGAPLVAPKPYRFADAELARAR